MNTFEVTKYTISFIPYYLIFILVLWSIWRKEKWVISTLLAFSFSSSALMFYFFEQATNQLGHFSVGFTIGMYASVVATIPFAVGGWVLGKKLNQKQSGMLIALGLILNFSVIKAYQYMINRSEQALKKEVTFDCQKLPYHCAIKEQKFDKIAEFKKAGFNIEAHDSLSRTPLWYALSNPIAVKALLENGANPDSFNIYEETPLAHSLVIGLKPNFEIAELLVKHGAQINRTVGFRKRIRILNFAIVNKNLPAINFALANGADPNLVDDYKKTACQRLMTFPKGEIKDLDKYCKY